MMAVSFHLTHEVFSMPHHPTTTTLEDVKQRFQQWRKHRAHGQKIPRDLMLLAVALLDHHKKHLVCKERLAPVRVCK